MTEVKDADIASSAWHMDLIVARRAQKGSAFGICSNIRTKQGFTSQSTGRSRWSDSVGRSPCIRNMPVSICRASLLCWGMLKRRDGLQKPLWIFISKWEQKLKLLPEKSRLASFAWPLHHMRLAVLQIWLDWKREELMCLPPNSFKL